MKKKTLLLSILSIIMCLSLTVGGTFALFTSKSEVNVAVTSGTVKVSASITNTEYSFDSRLTEASNCTYEINANGGLDINQMVPGDSIKATLSIVNDSDVAIQYKIKTEITGELAPYLEVVEINKKWTKIDAGVQVDDEYVTVSLPYEATNDAQEKSASVLITVEAVQGNAETFDEVYGQENIKDAFNNVDPSTGVAKVGLGEDYAHNSDITNDTVVYLNDKTFEATYSFNATANLTMKGGNYEMNGTYGHVDARPNEDNKEVALNYEDVNFTSNYRNFTYGTCTDRVESITEVYSVANGTTINLTYKNCTFNNAGIVLEDSSSYSGVTINVKFENCTFKALTSSSIINVHTYTDTVVNLTLKDCTFDIEATSQSACAVNVRKAATVTLEGTNTINAVAATPVTDAVDAKNNVKVFGTPANIKLVSYAAPATVVNNGTVIVSGIAIQQNY